MEYNWLLIFQFTMIILGNFTMYKFGHSRGECYTMKRNNEYLKSLIEGWKKKYDDK